MKHKLLKLLSAVAFTASMLGAAFLPAKSASAETMGAEWATGNSQVSVTMNYDVQNSEYSWWAFTAADTTRHKTYNNTGLAAAGMWYKTEYVGLKPMLYEAEYTTLNEYPTIHLGYYDGDFKMTSSPITPDQGNYRKNYDYMGVEYKFTDLSSGEYFTVNAQSSYASPSATAVVVTANGDTSKKQSGNISFGFISKIGGTLNQTNGTIDLFSLKYDTEANAIVTNRAMNSSFSLEAAGLTSAFDEYQVEMSFVGFRSVGRTGRLLVYSLNGLDLCGQTIDTLGNYHNTVLTQKKTEVVISDGSKINLSDLFGAWDAIRGDVTDQISYTVKDPSNKTLEVTDGKLAPTDTGLYTITCSVGTVTKTMTAMLGNHLVEMSQLHSSFLKGEALDFSSIVSVTDTVDGDILDQAKFTVYGPDGEEFDGETFSKLGEYKILCEVDYKGVSLTKEYKVVVNNPAQEWAIGNESVTATQGFNVTASDYGEGGENPGYWRIRLYDNNMITPYRSALQKENFWTKTSYENLKSTFYETVEGAEDPSLNLGYYDGDFGMAFTPVQSIVSNTYDANVNLDYYGLVYTFTDLVSGNYFQVKICNATNTDKYAKISVSVNGGEYSNGQNYHGSFGGRFNGATGSSNNGVFYIMNLKYDSAENKLKFNRDLGNSFDLSEFGLQNFTAYTVDMSFYKVQEGKTAKLCVYYLNDYDLTTAVNGQQVGSQILVEDEIPEDVFCGTTFTLPKVSVWDALDGGLLMPALQTRVVAPDGSEVGVENNAFTVVQDGKYTIEYSVVSETNGVETVQTKEFYALSSIPPARLVLSADIAQEVGVGGAIVMPAASFEFQEKTFSGWVVVELNGKIVASFYDSAVVNRLFVDEVGTYRVSYVYESKYGYMNAFTYEVSAVEKLVIVDPNLPERFVMGAEGYALEDGVAKIGTTEYEATIEIVAPSGTVVALNDAGLFVPEEIGVYSFIYRASVGNESVEEVYEMEVSYSSEALFKTNASIQELIPNQDARFVLNKDSNGVAVVSSSGGEVRFANVVDLATLGLTPIIEFQPLTKSDGYANLKTVIVTLTDIHDETNVVKIKWALNLDSFIYTYLSVNAGGNGYYGLRSDGYVFKNQYGANKGCSFYVDQYDPQYLSNICMDFKENQFKADLYNGSYLLVIDSDDVNQVGDGYQWKGFTTGEVYVSLSMPDATNGGVIITSIAGQSLAGEKIVDGAAPTIVVNADRAYLDEGMPEGVVGMEYPVPSAIARDLLSAKSTLAFHVEYKNTQSGEWEEVSLVGGKFIPEVAGEYKLVWTATDIVGNVGKKELAVQVNEAPNEIAIAFSEDLSEIYVGNKTYIPVIEAVGGNGKVSYTVEWFFDGKAIDFTAPGFYRATAKGALVAKVTATDYLGNVKTEELTIEIKNPDLPVLNVLDVPTSVVKGATLVLPDFTAIDYAYKNGESGYEAERKIYVNDTEIDLANRTFTVTQNAGSVLTVRYVGAGKNGTTEKTYSIYVLEPTFVSDYLIYDSSKVTSALNEAYTELSAAEDFTVKMPNPVSTQDMIICFYVDTAHLAAGGTVSMLMVDANDATLQLKITVKQISEGKLGLYLNEATEKLMPITLKADGAVYFTFNSFTKEISDAAGKKVLTVEYDLNGYLFDGFESGGANISFTVNGVTQTTFFRLNQVGNQRFVTSYFNGEAQAYVDRIPPQLSYTFAMNSTSLQMGDRIEVAAAKAFDVLQSNASVTVTVESPTKVLYSGVAIDESFSFVTEEYGYYTITYTVKAGARTEKLPSYFIKVIDETPPTLTVNGQIAESCNVGSTLSLPSATISDDNTLAEDLKFFVFVIEPCGRYVDVTESLSYQVEKTGKYTVVYYLVDNDYNVMRQEYVVIAK